LSTCLTELYISKLLVLIMITKVENILLSGWSIDLLICVYNSIKLLPGIDDDIES